MLDPTDLIFRRIAILHLINIGDNMFAKIAKFFQEKRKQRFRKAIANKRAMKEDRWLGLVAMGEIKDPAFAVPALLARFEYNLDNSILDSREKEQAIASIMNFPAAEVLPIVRENLQKTEHIAWTLKLLLKVSDEEETRKSLFACLDFGDVAFDRATIDKNYDILCHLQDFDLQALDRRVEHFLHDNDERVRFAATELIIKQGAEHVPAVLEKFLLDDSAENTRIRQVVLDAFVEKRWAISNKRAFKKCEAAESVILNKNGTLQPIA